MPVIDASVMVDALVTSGAPGLAARSEVADLATLTVPSIFLAECVSAIRGLALRRELSPTRAAAAVDRLHRLSTSEFGFRPFGARVWALRDTMTPYDAWYVALAETLQVDLVTADARLTRVPGLNCRVRAPTP